eukprot:scpid100896/ scgid7284/ 
MRARISVDDKNKVNVDDLAVSRFFSINKLFPVGYCSSQSTSSSLWMPLQIMATTISHTHTARVWCLLDTLGHGNQASKTMRTQIRKASHLAANLQVTTVTHGHCH